jgi:hypothetical protein
MKRPFGVTVLAAIWAFAGTMYVLAGLQLTTAVTFGPVQAGSGSWLWGWVIVLTGLLFWAAAGAALSLKPWAWQLGVFLALWGLLQAFFIVLGAGTWEMAMAATAWPLLLFWYLHREPVRRAFGIEEEFDAAA